MPFMISDSSIVNPAARKPKQQEGKEKKSKFLEIIKMIFATPS
jgi:hypothetical protein